MSLTTIDWVSAPRAPRPSLLKPPPTRHAPPAATARFRRSSRSPQPGQLVSRSPRVPLLRKSSKNTQSCSPSTHQSSPQTSCLCSHGHSSATIYPSPFELHSLRHARNEDALADSSKKSVASKMSSVSGASVAFSTRSSETVFTNNHHLRSEPRRGIPIRQGQLLQCRSSRPAAP